MAYQRDSGYTSVLLHFDAIDGSATIVDETTKSWSLAGGILQHTTQSKFGGSSLQFDGSNDYISTPDHLDFYLVSDFSFDVWLRFQDFPVDGSSYFIFQQYQDANNWQSISFKNNGGVHSFNFQIRTGGADDVNFTKACASNLDLNTWYHLRLCRSGNDYIFYVNGAKIGTTETDASAIANFTGTVYIGCHAGTGSFFYGFMDEFRLIKGQAVVTGDSFIVPTVAFSPHIDEAYTVHLIHFDGYDSKAGVCDESGINWTMINQAQIDTAQSKFGGSSLLMDGTADGISTTDTDNHYLADRDFCIEMFARFAALPGAGTFQTLWCNPTDTNNRIMMVIYNNGGSYELRCQVTISSVLQFSSIRTLAGLAIDTWYHFAWNRASMVHRSFWDGVQLGANEPDASVFPNYTGLVYLGVVDGTASAVNGWIDEYRLSVDSSRGGAAFALPLSPYGPVIANSESLTTIDSHAMIDNSIVIDLPVATIDIDASMAFKMMSFELPLTQVNITGKTGWTGYVTIPLPLIELSATGLTGELGQVDIDLPLSTVFLSGGGHLSIDLPLLQSNINLLVGCVGGINTMLPKLALALAGHTDENGQIEIDLPISVLNLTGKQSEFGSLGLNMPLPGVLLTGLTGTIGQIDLTLPRLQVNVTSFVRGNMTMDITLPGILINLHGISTPISVSYKGVVINLKNMAVTEYADFHFNSVGSLSGSQFGANSNGIYVLTGNTLSEASFMSGSLDMGRSVLGIPRNCWLTMRANGAITMTVLIDETDTYTYDLTGLPNVIHEERVKFGKGIKGRYISFGLKNVNSADFDISSIALFAEEIMSKKR